MARRRRPQRRQAPFYRLLDTAARRILAEALRANDGNRTHTAQELGVSRTYFTRMLKHYGIQDYSQTTGGSRYRYAEGA